MATIEQNQLDLISSSFESAHPQDILRWAVEIYGQTLTVVTSFQPTGIVTAHMISQIAPSTKFMTLDTGLIFAETHKLIHQIENRLGVQVQRIKPQQTLGEQGSTYGDELWQRFPDLCCTVRKIIPLKSVLKHYDAWIAGLRRDQSDKRQNTPIISWDNRNQTVKICPFANWTEDMIWTYIQAYELPYNELHDQNYPSIGCSVCTHPVASGAATRSGRWAGMNKTECGIHYQEIS